MDSVKAMAKCALVIFSSLFSLGKGHYERWGSPPQTSPQHPTSPISLFHWFPTTIFHTWMHCGCQPWDVATSEVLSCCRLKQVHRQRPLDSLSVGSLLVAPWPLGALRMTRFHTFPDFHLILADVMIPWLAWPWGIWPVLWMQVPSWMHTTQAVNHLFAFSVPQLQMNRLRDGKTSSHWQMCVMCYNFGLDHCLSNSLGFLLTVSTFQ